MGINILICDEDKISLKINSTYIEEFSEKYKIKSEIAAFNNVDQILYNYINKNNVDIAILDVDFHNSPGLSLAKEILKNNSWVSIIFVTEHTEYALEAFHLLALGFIQKPIRQLRFEKLFARAIIQAQSLRHRKSHGILNITVNKSELAIKQNSIVYMEKVQQKTKVITVQSSYEIYETLSSIENRLGYSFLRVNQSTIVNMEDILLIEHNIIYIKTGKNFKIGRSYVKKVKEKYSNFTFFE